MEATCYSRCRERLLAELGIELWIGDAAKIKTKRVRKQKTDRNDAQLLLRLLLDHNFPKIRVSDPENRDLRQLLWHRHRLAQMRTRIMSQLQAIAMNEGQRRKKKLWSEAGRAQLEELTLGPWASRRHAKRHLRIESRVTNTQTSPDNHQLAGYVRLQHPRCRSLRRQVRERAWMCRLEMCRLER
jgi:transposase